MSLNGVKLFAQVNAFKSNDNNPMAKTTLHSIIRDAVAASLQSYLQELQDSLWNSLLEFLKWCVTGAFLIGGQPFRDYSVKISLILKYSAPVICSGGCKTGAQTRATT
jgi:hypothetical protein